MTYDLTLLENLTNPLEFIIAINTMSNNLFGGMIIVLIYFIIFFASDPEYFPNLLLAAGIFMGLICGILRYLDFVPSWYLAMNLIAITAAIIIKVFGANKNS